MVEDEPFVLNESSLTEIADNKGHFKWVGSTQIRNYPRRSEVLNKLVQLEGSFSREVGFFCFTPQIGRNFYYLSNAYTARLCLWLNQADSLPTRHKLCVINRDLFENSSFSKVKYQNMDHIGHLVKEETWRQLVAWFGGGPEIKVKCVSGSTKILGTLVRVVVQDEITKFRRFYFNIEESIESVMAELCQMFNTNIERCNLFDFQNSTQLDTNSTKRSKLSSTRVGYDHLLYIENLEAYITAVVNEPPLNIEIVDSDSNPSYPTDPFDGIDEADLPMSDLERDFPLSDSWEVQRNNRNISRTRNSLEDILINRPRPAIIPPPPRNLIVSDLVSENSTQVTPHSVKPVEPRISEIQDDKGHFVKYPTTSLAEYPAQSFVLTVLTDHDKNFTTANGFTTIVPQDGEFYYLLSKPYVWRLLNWLKQDDSQVLTSHLNVDNTSLFETGFKTKVKKRLNESSYEIVTTETWKSLISWFGGGPEVRFKCVHGILCRTGKLLRVVKQPNLGECRRFYFNPEESVQNVKKEICEAFNVQFSKCRLHDYYKFKPACRVDTKLSLRTPINRKNLVYDNLLLLEIPNSSGIYEIKYEGAADEEVNVDNEAARTVVSETTVPLLAETTSISSLRDHFQELTPPPPLDEPPPPPFQEDEEFLVLDILSGEGTTPAGLVGLSNNGHFSYMNSILQCLSNIQPLKELFLTKSYRTDIGQTTSRSFRGKMANAFFSVLEKIWSGEGNVLSIIGFKNVLKLAKPEFNRLNNREHDAYKFLLELLSALHDDVNKAKDRPLPLILNPALSDEALALQTITNARKSDNSSIADLFTGLAKTIYTCACGAVSVQFEPYRTINLAVELKKEILHKVQVIFVPRNPRQPPIRISCIVPRTGPVYQLREMLKRKLRIHEKNETELSWIETNRVPEQPRDKDAILSMGYEETDEDILGKRDIIIFGISNSRLTGPIHNSQSVESLSSLRNLICYETFDNYSFEVTNFALEAEWKRKLEFPRPDIKSEVSDSDSDESDYEVDEEDKEVIGYQNCPFIKADTWVGEYTINHQVQLLRFEVFDVEKYDWTAYHSYSQEIHSKYGQQKDNKLTRRQFKETETFFIHLIADSKEQNRENGTYQTCFELKGLYINMKNHEYTDMQNDNILQKLQHRFAHGFFVLRPTANRKIIPTPSSSTHLPNRKAISFTGCVDSKFNQLWGTNLFAYRVESRNWIYDELISSVTEPGDANPVFNRSKYPRYRPIDDRLLVMVCHKINRRGFSGIPDSFFVPAEVTESDLMQLLTARMKIFMEKEFEVSGQKRFVVTNDTNEETDLVERFSKSVKVVRANARFDTMRTTNSSDRLNVGIELDAQSDTPLNLANDVFIWLVCTWEENYPFSLGRPTDLLKHTEVLETVTFDTALHNFSHPTEVVARHCNACLKPMSATKQQQIWSVPEILVFKYNRFPTQNSIFKEKLKLPVDFPLSLNAKDIAISKEVYQPINTEIEQVIRPTVGNRKYEYDLSAVVSHNGNSSNAGHYSACAKNLEDGNWYEFDDEKVTKIETTQKNKIVRKDAYIVFYTRRNSVER